MIGTRVGSWLVTEEIGDGGHAFVFKGVAGKDVVAIKMLKPSVAGEDNLEKRFKIEAEALRNLSHGSIVGFKDYIYVNGYHYLVLEFMDAGAVDHLLRTVGPIEARYVIPIFDKVLEGVTYAHSFGYIHRDIKPNNILLNRQGDAKLTDFGIAKVIGGENLTRQGFVLGTTPYMAPEYLSQGVVNPQTDIYALGVTLYEMVTNRKPFEQKDDDEPLVEFAKRVCFGTPTPPSAYRPIPEELEKIILKAVARDPKKRYKSTDRFQAEMRKAFPEFVDRPIEIPDGRPKTRAISMEEVAATAPRPASPTAVRRARLNPVTVFVAAAAAAAVVGVAGALLLDLGPLIAAGLAVAAAGLVIGGAFLWERRSAPAKPAAAPSPAAAAPAPAKKAAAAAPAAPALAAPADDPMPFHAGAAPQGEFKETHISELSAFLVVTSGPQQGKRYGLRPISRIGRDLRYDIRPHDPEISRHHSALKFNGAGFTIQDTGSTNGTFVNEEKVTAERELENGDIVRVGRTSMRFEHTPGG